MAKILVIDDSRIQRNAIAKIVKGLGHEVLLAANGQEGLEVIQAEKLDCVFSDLLMPEVGGIELLEQLYELGHQVPVVIISADKQKTVKERCMSLGAREFMSKPPKHDEIKAFLETLFTRAA